MRQTFQYVVSAGVAALLLFGLAERSIPPVAAGAGAASVAFDRFKFSFFKDPTSAQDALDTAALEQLQGDERKRAEDMLIAFLPDSRAVIGLGVLRSQRAKLRLMALFVGERARQAVAVAGFDNDWNPLGIVYLARALWLIDPDPQWPAAAIDVLRFSKSWTARQEAADALSGVRDPASVDALIKALDDGEPLVRFSAARALLATYGQPAQPMDPSAVVYRGDVERRRPSCGRQKRHHGRHCGASAGGAVTAVSSGSERGPAVASRSCAPRVIL